MTKFYEIITSLSVLGVSALLLTQGFTNFSGVIIPSLISVAICVTCYLLFPLNNIKYTEQSLKWFKPITNFILLALLITIFVWEQSYFEQYKVYCIIVLFLLAGQQTLELLRSKLLISKK